jgi:hypothetical protein
MSGGRLRPLLPERTERDVIGRRLTDERIATPRLPEATVSFTIGNIFFYHNRQTVSKLWFSILAETATGEERVR